jgi:hypothetical protein
MTTGLCVICNKPCIAMCPSCTRFVHHAYGQCNENCGGRHEATCPGARALREGLVKDQPAFPTTKLVPPPAPIVKKRRGRKR